MDTAVIDRRINSFYNIQNKGEDTAVIDLIGVINDFWTGDNSKEVFLAQLKGIKASNITVNISSPGGDSADAMAIYDALKGHPARVTARLSGLVASAATTVACGADVVEASPTCIYMIHNHWIFTAGNKKEMEKTMKALDTFDKVAAGIYKKRTGQRLDTIKRMMDEETYMTAQEAKDFGFVDKIIEGITFENQVTLEDLEVRNYMSSTLNCAKLPPVAAGEAPEIPINSQTDNNIMDNLNTEQQGAFVRFVNSLIGKKNDEAEIAETPQAETNELEALRNEVADLKQQLSEAKNTETFDVQAFANSIANAINGKVEEVAKEVVNEATEAVKNEVTELKAEVEKVADKVNNSTEVEALTEKVEEVAKAVNKTKTLEAQPETPTNNGEGLEKVVAPENTWLHTVKNFSKN
jgi:ATP-dependent protease ClpP protease subunit/phage terminase Nu1 subunit (DNA packaging protein)